MRARRLGEKEHAEDVRLERAAQLFLANVSYVFVRMLLARIVDENVYASQFLHDLIDCPAAKGFVSQIPGDRDGAGAFAFDDIHGLFRVVMLAQIEDSHVRAFARIKRGDRPAYAAVAAGDDRHLAGKTARAGIAWLPFGLRLQPAFMAGKRVFMNHVGHLGHRDSPSLSNKRISLA
jgi:hypothetical protein